MADHITFAEKAIKILLIEDHLGDVLLFKNACQGWINNTEIVSVSSTGKALQELSTNNYNVVFSDLNTGDSTGPNSVHDIRKEHPHIPIIVLTGIATNLTREECKKAGANGFMVKSELTGQAIAKILETLLLI